MKKANKNLILAMGTGLLGGVVSVSHADVETSSLFALTELSSGYMQIAGAATDAAKPKTPEAKTPPAKCAGTKPMSESKAKETQCGGQGQCGSMHPQSKADDHQSTPAPAANKAQDGKCGSNMKKPEETQSKSEPQK